MTNYHAHTRWCRHATGEIEEVILEAIDKGYKEFAISEHVPYEKFYDSRIYFEELEEYMNELEYVKEKYADQIKVLKAFECEYFEEYHEHYESLVKKYDLDFLILGQHWTNMSKDIDYFITKSDEDVKQYEKDVIRGMKSGLFKMVAHPDVFLARYECTEQGLKTANEIFKVAQEHEIALEINANGIRNGLGYPSEKFWTESKKYDLIYLINSDSHSVDAVKDMYIPKAYEFAEKLGIKVTENLI